MSKQAVHKQMLADSVFEEKLSGLIMEVDTLRAQHPGCGLEKVYHTLRPGFIGRDRFIDIFMDLGYRVKKHKNYRRTTWPGHISYPNLIEGMDLNDRNMVWQSDITYFHAGGRFYYIVLIMDVYTKCILGHQVSGHLRAEANLLSLKQALRQYDKSLGGLIHHSDRGSQYIDKRYIKLLGQNNISISMGEKGQENAYAERLNGIIKDEYLKYRDINNLSQLTREVSKTVQHYNKERRHRSLPGWQTPPGFDRELDTSPIREKTVIYAKNRPFINGGTPVDKTTNSERKFVCTFTVK